VLANAPQRLDELLPDGSAARADGPPRNIVYMGSFMSYKNVETLVRGMAGLPGRTLHLLSRISPERRRELEALVPQGASVVFHGGVSDAEYAELLSDRAILATLSLDEGYGLPIAEALAFGVPAVVSDLEIFREVAGEGALFVPARDPAAFAAAVRSLDDDATRERVIAAGRAHMERFSWERSAGALLDAVRGLAR
jgi:glycosyltransferase involved in cell wall biosynthesis